MVQGEGTFLVQQLQSALPPLLVHAELQLQAMRELPQVILQNDQVILLRSLKHHQVISHLQGDGKDQGAIFRQEHIRRIGEH